MTAATLSDSWASPQLSQVTDLDCICTVGEFWSIFKAVILTNMAFCGHNDTNRLSKKSVFSRYLDLCDIS